MTEHFQASIEILPDVPAALRAGRRFVAWRYETRSGQPKPTKVPYSPDAPKGASSTTPSHWTTFETALTYARVAGLDGIGRVLVAEDGLVGVDLDHCRDPETGTLTERAAEIVRRLDTYTEVSPSGTGVKLWAYGTLPATGRKRGDTEMYCTARYFTLTGRHVEGTPATVGYRPDAILAVHREVFGDAPDPTITADDPDRDVPALQLGDEDVIRLASESAHNGARFRRLWSGDASDYARDGNDGASEADAALCELLAFYGGPDPERIDRLYRRSALCRAKWERADYRARTIDLAARGKTRFYGDTLGSAPPASTPTDPGRVAYLEGALLDRDDLIEAQQIVIRAERAENRRLAEQIKGWRVVLSNPKLKPADRIAALPAIEHVLAARANGQAEIHVRYPGIVNGWGLTESTLGKSMDILTEPDGAPLAKRAEPGPGVTVETRRGPRTVYPPMVLLRAAVDTDLYAAVGSYDPQLPQRGGTRTAPPPCPDHPDLADYVERSVPQCAACRRPLEAARERWFTRRQNDGLTDGAPETVVVRTLGRQNDGLSDGRSSRLQNDGVSDGHDGEDQAEQEEVHCGRNLPPAETVLTLPIRPPRREWYEQPSWLEDQPDPPDPVPMLSRYDDVLIAGGES